MNGTRAALLVAVGTLGAACAAPLGMLRPASVLHPGVVEIGPGVEAVAPFAPQAPPRQGFAAGIAPSLSAAFGLGRLFEAGLSVGPAAASFFGRRQILSGTWDAALGVAIDGRFVADAPHLRGASLSAPLVIGSSANGMYFGWLSVAPIAGLYDSDLGGGALVGAAASIGVRIGAGPIAVAAGLSFLYVRTMPAGGEAVDQLALAPATALVVTLR